MDEDYDGDDADDDDSYVCGREKSLFDHLKHGQWKTFRCAT